MDAFQPTCAFTPVYKGQLYYEVIGVGQPLLLIHAGVADCSMWDAQFNTFGQYYRVIRYDARGFGRSQTETVEYTNRQDILDLFAHLQVEKAAIVGISRGGQIAIDFTLEHPESVLALVAVAAGISGYSHQPNHSEKARQELELFSRADELWERQEFDELADLEAHVWADGPSQPLGRASAQIHDYVRNVVRANYVRQDGQATPIPLEPPASNRLAEIQAPTLVLVGEYDTASTLASADKLTREIPGARKLLVSGAAHMLPMEKPAVFNEIVLNFLRQEI